MKKIEIFNENSGEYFSIINLIEENKILSKANLKQLDYKEYNYFETEEYKNENIIQTIFLYGFFVNYFHNYKEDQKKNAEKLIEVFKSNFTSIKASFFENIENIQKETNSFLNRYSKIFNSIWDNIIRNKQKYLKLTQEIKDYLTKKLYN